ncbi:MAG: CHAP domain-containing protein [Streptococcus sp.]|nr:CHAP domain-containing protein [Streptococcus sp.]
MKKKLFRKIFLSIGLPLLLILFVMAFILAIIYGGVAENNASNKGGCSTGTESGVSTGTETVSANSSIEEFVKEHEQAYIESWKVGGFLPSASIVQTMIETSFNQSVDSFGEAHNMGGVKWSKKSDFTATIGLYGDNSVSSEGPGIEVGDNTGGKYAYFATFDSGIVGKAEFMKNQTLYTNAINNTDGISTLSAIADGGWATDPEYKTKLHNFYNDLGSKFKWLDEKAIAKYGSAPVNKTATTEETQTSDDSSSTSGGSKSKNCGGKGTDGKSGDAVDGSGTYPPEATAWGYTPYDLPESLKPYVIDPQAFGMEYGGSGANWEHPDEGFLAGQCVNLTISLGNLIWGHKGVVIGNGIDQAAAWAKIFGNQVKTTPKKGAIFSCQSTKRKDGTRNPAGHTGIVCHVFEDGTIFVCEQNTILSGTMVDKPFTWSLRRVPMDEIKEDNYVYAYPDDRNPKLSSNDSGK